jgi:hypothetical protein
MWAEIPNWPQTSTDRPGQPASLFLEIRGGL